MPSALIRRIKRQRNPEYEKRAEYLAHEIVKAESETKALRKLRGLDCDPEYQPVSVHDLAP